MPPRLVLSPPTLALALSPRRRLGGGGSLRYISPVLFRRVCCHAAPKPRERFRAFTLLEMLVVIGIIAILLVAIVPAVTSLSKSSGRKGAMSNLLGAIEQARAEAIKTGQATYVVFPTFSTATRSTIDRYNYKSYAIFEDDSANPTAPKQLTNWKTLPTGVALRSAGGGRLSSLTDTSAMSPAFTPIFTPESTATAVFRGIKFNAAGEVEFPASNVSLTIFEGSVDAPGGNEIITSAKDTNGDPAARESLTIAQLTGRAERVP